MENNWLILRSRRDMTNVKMISGSKCTVLWYVISVILLHDFGSQILPCCCWVTCLVTCCSVRLIRCWLNCCCVNCCCWTTCCCCCCWTTCCCCCCCCCVWRCIVASTHDYTQRNPTLNCLTVTRRGKKKNDRKKRPQASIHGREKRSSHYTASTEKPQN